MITTLVTTIPGVRGSATCKIGAAREKEVIKRLGNKKSDAPGGLGQNNWNVAVFICMFL